MKKDLSLGDLKKQEKKVEQIFIKKKSSQVDFKFF